MNIQTWTSAVTRMWRRCVVRPVSVLTYPATICVRVCRDSVELQASTARVTSEHFTNYLWCNFRRSLLLTVRPVVWNRWPVCHVCLSVCKLVYCGRTVGWIKMSLGTEVGLGTGDIVSDGDPAPPSKSGTAEPPLFGPCLL